MTTRSFHTWFDIFYVVDTAWIKLIETRVKYFETILNSREFQDFREIPASNRVPNDSCFLLYTQIRSDSKRFGSHRYLFVTRVSDRAN